MNSSIRVGPTISRKEIRSLCGSTAFSRGESYFLNRKVIRLDYDPDEVRYRAVVKGSSSYDVSIVLDDNEIEAECDCPAYDSNYTYCKHIAAVLLQIEELGKKQGGSSPRQSLAALVKAPIAFNQAALPPKPAPEAPKISERDLKVARNVLSLFERPASVASRYSDASSAEPRQAAVEFTCKIETGHRNRVWMEMKVGVGRLYVVQKLGDFLDKLDKRIPFVFTKLFTFDPRVHHFSEQDAEIIGLLLNTYRLERSYREMSSYSYYHYSSGNDRMLYIPPSIWESLLPKLSGATIRYEVGGRSYEKIAADDGEAPLFFELGPGPVDDAYQLEMKGLFGLKLAPSYGFAIAEEGKLFRMDQETMARLSELQSVLSVSKESHVTIPPLQVDSFLRRVVPALKRIGGFRVDKQIADRVVNEPLKAKVYLDRDDEGLHAEAEFVYGEARISPLDPKDGKEPAHNRLVMRDTERENLVLDLLRSAGFRLRGDKLILDGDDEQYGFLYGGLERLQQLADVFATPAVQAIRSQSSYKPRAVADIDAQTNWLEVRFELEGVDAKELAQLLRSVQEKKKYHKLSNGSFVSLEDEGFGEIARLFEELSIRKSELNGDRVKMSVVRGLALSEREGGAGTAHVKLGKSLRRMLDNLKNPDNLDFEPPVSLAPVLRDYQKYGFQWLKMLSHYGFGGILADDMGLGKTLQSIAYISSEREGREETGASVLIVCPASLVYNWKNELAKFAPHLKVAAAAGGKAERDAILSDADRVDVLITSYPLLRRDTEWYSEQHFHALFLDEAQAIKNHATQTAQAVKTISATHRFALTGTPVENRLEELWSIYDAVFPELFNGRKAFIDLKAEQVARKVRPFLLRRLKSDVLTELPDKIETLQKSELLPEQKKLYMAYLMQLQDETSAQLEAEGFQKSRMKILAGLTRLRQLCCHPSLFIEQYQGESGKMEQLLELIEECLAAGKRMLVFSQFTGMLELIRTELNKRGWSYFYLDGATKSSERVELCSRFNEGETDMFLISLKAGGTGLNLTGADTVILCDLWWNPAVEQQAADRAHRIGQKNVVQVIRLMTEGTIEEKMYELQQRKKDLIDTVVQPGEEALSSLTEKDIRELLAI